MAITHLPPSVLDTGSPTPSPLASYLGALVGNDGTPSPTLSEAGVRGALASATLPFDPDEVMETPSSRVSGQPYKWTLLEAALEMGAEEHPAAPAREWPKQIEQFDSNLYAKHLAQRSGVGTRNASPLNAEWLAAAVVAAGCNPWNDGREDPNALPLAVSQSIQLGYAGLLKRFLQCPGAWSAQRVWDAPLVYSKSSSLGERAGVAASGLGSTHVIEVLMDQGARPASDEELVGLLSAAHPDMIEAVMSRVLRKPGPKHQKALTNAWGERVKKGMLDVEDLTRMTAMVSDVNNEEELYARLQVDQLLTTDWGKEPNGSKSQAYDFMPDHTPKVLSTQVTKKGGPSAGNWSVLAAAAFSRIRQTASRGALGWSVAVMLPTLRDPNTKDWVRPNLDSPELKGCLKDAIGFDWRPGIAIDGVVALAALGQQGGVSSNDPHLKANLRDLERALGVPDLNAWATEHAQAAAEFTLAILKTSSLTQAKPMLTTWATALSRNPGIAQGIRLDTAVDLMLSLSGHFRIMAQFQAGPAQLDAINSLYRSLFPHLTPLYQGMVPERPFEGVELKAALAVLLNQSGDGIVGGIKPYIEKATDEHFQLIESRIELIGSAQAREKALAQLMEWRLAQRLEPGAQEDTPSPQGRRGPRF